MHPLFHVDAFWSHFITFASTQNTAYVRFRFLVWAAWNYDTLAFSQFCLSGAFQGALLSFRVVNVDSLTFEKLAANYFSFLRRKERIFEFAFGCVYVCVNLPPPPLGRIWLSAVRPRVTWGLFVGRRANHFVMHSRRPTIAPSTDFPLSVRWLSTAYIGFHFLCSFFVWKIKSPARPIFFKFSGQLCHGLICSHCRNAIFSSKNNVCLEHPALFATLFRMVWMEKWK